MSPLHLDHRKLSITKIFTFDSAHQLVDLCNSPCQNPHGHTYTLEVTIQEVDTYAFYNREQAVPMIMDFSFLKEVVKTLIDTHLDHKDLNVSLSSFNPTAEFICLFIWQELDKMLSTDTVVLQKIRLWETPTSYCTLERE